MPHRPQHERADGGQCCPGKELDEACQGSQGGTARGKPWQEGQRSPPSVSRQEGPPIDGGDGQDGEPQQATELETAKA